MITNQMFKDVCIFAFAERELWNILRSYKGNWKEKIKLMTGYYYNFDNMVQLNFDLYDI